MGLVDTLLERSVHPEISHLHSGHHPGRHWWLKTICPDWRLERLDVHHFGRKWNELAQSLPCLVQLTEVAFDWFGNRLPYTGSVWLREGIDVKMRCIGDNQLHLTVVDDLTGLRDAIEQLRHHEEGSEEIFQALEDEIRTKESQIARQQLQVIHGRCN